jgi:nucleoside-diphosphate-sugar epimerase
VLYGADQTRAFLYIDDAVDIVKRLSDLTNNDTVNVGNPVETSISDTATIIRKCLGITHTPILKTSPPGSVNRRCADLSKMSSLIGDYNFTNLEHGVKKLLIDLLA